jgi:hypothetical protein
MNNPEGLWVNWLICDEIYQMYAGKKNDPSIIWRNAIKFYDIEHQHFTYQDQDEYDLTTAIYAGTQPNAKFRTPPTIPATAGTLTAWISAARATPPLQSAYVR